jgi:hypothetical protein
MALPALSHDTLLLYFVSFFCSSCALIGVGVDFGSTFYMSSHWFLPSLVFFAMIGLV